MIELQDIFKKYGEEYRKEHKISLAQYKAFNAILNCRTAVLGGHVDSCPNCGEQKISYNSCRNRHCPKCQTLSKERWIDAQKANLLNVGYFHIVFTVAQELNSIIYSNQEKMYKLLFKCSAETLKELSLDKKYLGANIGHTAVLHTWGQNLSFHPHVHCIVPSGGLTALQKWKSSKKKFFIPVKVISRKFRGKFLSLLKAEFADFDLNLLNTCYNKEWIVYCKPPFKTAECVVEYLGRYTHRVAISNNRILKDEDGHISFKWKNYRDGNKSEIMTISAEEFIRRFLMHILPSGFMKIRHYGFLSSRGKQIKLKICKELTKTSLVERIKASAEALIEKLIGRKPSVCPVCGYSGLVRTGLSPPTV